MTGPGELFEDYVRFIYQMLLEAQGKNIVVTRRAPVTDNRGNTYNIDVFYEFIVAGVQHRVAIECKDTQRPVERDDVIAFAGKLLDMPSTIGVFISRNGFQQGARKYLEDHGILYYSDTDLPSFADSLAAKVKAVALPGKDAVGQPFWGLMEIADGAITGSWWLMPDGSGAMPLFFSRPHAEQFWQHALSSAGNVCIRGIEQSTLWLLITCARDEERAFMTVRPFEQNGKLLFRAEQWTAAELGEEFVHERS
ncbi:restriction endonuclease [Phytomonospora endophytica]|uniref:Restriction endonuclease type IV Mrr domain-containing protein n=1 Tax=Phytomonospora endophytica TaxID=714109 RepID=A0A841FNT3_9ACTN|nr:restriction endonuclease [Phytomonospora endophytica]MBB6037755.1 hypothetical protein [Phytomonospora endophytica]GIG67716.1 hypothetical protein Pen01_40110 [Phytomonospora endophytica]